MDGNCETPGAKSVPSQLNIANIFMSIQQKLKEANSTNTGESGDSALTAHSATASAPSSNSSEVSAPASGSASSTSKTSETTVLESELSGDISEAPAPAPEPTDLPQAGGPAGMVQQPSENMPGQRRREEADMCNTPALEAPLSEASQLDNTVVKQEKEDPGYEFHCHGSSFREGSGDKRVNGKEGSSDIVISREEKDCAEQGNDGDVFCGVDYRDPDDSSDSETDCDTSVSSFEVMQVEEPVEEPEDKAVIPRTKGEVLPEELPPLENLHISLPKDIKLEQLGVVTGIVGVLVVVESTVDLKYYSPLNDDTVLFFENKQPLGVVFEVFGQCKAPAYCIRFNSTQDIKEKGIEIGLKVFFVPEPVPEVGDITHYVFVKKLKQIKGSDASWENNNEPPENCVDYSDDEQEKQAKARRKTARTKGREGASEPKKRNGDDTRKEKKGKPQQRPGSGGSSGNTLTKGGTSSPQPPSCGQERRLTHFRKDFSLSEPVFSGPANAVRHPPPQASCWGPPARPHHSHSCRGGPFAGGPGHPRSGPVGGGPVGAPFPGRPFGGLFRAPFPGNPASGAFGPTFSGGPWGAPHAQSTFSFGQSVPPPTGGSFTGGQMGAVQGHPPSPGTWSTSRQPQFNMTYNGAPFSQTANSNSSQPFRFSAGPGQLRPTQPLLGPGPQQPPVFQGQPQFVQHHQGQRWR